MKLHKDAPSGLVTKHWFVSLLLAILFGYIGAERFYFGHYKIAVAKLLVGGAFIGWWIADPHMTVPKMVLFSVVVLWWITDIAFVGGRTVKGIWWSDDARWK